MLLKELNLGLFYPLNDTKIGFGLKLEGIHYLLFMPHTLRPIPHSQPFPLACYNELHFATLYFY